MPLSLRADSPFVPIARISPLSADDGSAPGLQVVTHPDDAVAVARPLSLAAPQPGACRPERPARWRCHRAARIAGVTSSVALALGVGLAGTAAALRDPPPVLYVCAFISLMAAAGLGVAALGQLYQPPEPPLLPLRSAPPPPLPNLFRLSAQMATA